MIDTLRNDDPIFVGIEKVFARIVSNQCNKKNHTINNQFHDFITYHCNVMNIFSCPFESKEESKLPYTKEDLFTLQRISFAIEQAITTFFEITKNNEIIYEADFENDRVQEIHTNYNGEQENWGWQENVKEQLSKVKPISTIQIINEQDIYNILTNREKLEYLLQEYYNEEQQKQELEEELDREYLKANLKVQIEEELKKQEKEQQILLKENKQTIIDLILDNKNSIKIEDLKIYEPIYKCYRQKESCHMCNIKSNIICINCNNHNDNKEVWLCANHWQEHTIDKHKQ